MKQDLLEKLKLELERSTLSEKDKLDLVSVFSRFPEVEAKMLLELIGEDNDILHLLSDNLKLKRDINLDDKDSWKKVFDNEKEVLSSIN